MWSRSFSTSLYTYSCSRRKEIRQRRQKRNASSSSKSSSTQSPQQNSSIDSSSRGWWNRAATTLSSTVAGIGTSLQNALPKNFEVPVKVDVDMIKPTLVSIQSSVQENWARLPKPVREIAPYITVAWLSGWIVHHFDHRQLTAERAKTAELESEIRALEEEKNQRPPALSSDGAAYIAAFGAALEQASNAAARATEAAAVAAETCALRSRRAVRPIPQQSRPKPSTSVPDLGNVRL